MPDALSATSGARETPCKPSDGRVEGGCSLPTPGDPVFIPHAVEKRGVRTRIDREVNPQFIGPFPPPPQVTESARFTLSRWRHGFEPRWDYAGQRPNPGFAVASGPALAPRCTGGRHGKVFGDTAEDKQVDST
jgi:hypothetical protein